MDMIASTTHRAAQFPRLNKKRTKNKIASPKNIPLKIKPKFFDLFPILVIYALFSLLSVSSRSFLYTNALLYLLRPIC